MQKCPKIESIVVYASPKTNPELKQTIKDYLVNNLKSFINSEKDDIKHAVEDRANGLLQQLAEKYDIKSKLHFQACHIKDSVVLIPGNRPTRKFLKDLGEIVIN
ncbi:MAG: hypothetical protein M0R03_11475 [Novosphingobium sp.]|nr:hypothetical protein [Novosphingobium sp.]